MHRSRKIWSGLKAAVQSHTLLHGRYYNFCSRLIASFTIKLKFAFGLYSMPNATIVLHGSNQGVIQQAEVGENSRKNGFSDISSSNTFPSSSIS